MVTEIRALRAELRQTTHASTEMQLLTARLQLQEQRITTLANQRADVMARLSVETGLRTQAEQMVRTFTEERSRNVDVGAPREELDAQEQNFKASLGQHRDAERQLQAQERGLSAEIANEQGRWQDFNNRLDELERSLK